MWMELASSALIVVTTVMVLFSPSRVAAQTIQNIDDTKLRRFEVVSVKENTNADRTVDILPQPPDGFRQANLANLDLLSYIIIAFDVHQPQRLDGVPDSTWQRRYDIVAKASGPVTEQQRMAMLRDVLVTRFHLKTHFETREQMVYVMTAAHPDRRIGPGLKPRIDCAATDCESTGSFRPQGLEMRAVTLKQLADGMLSALARQLVIDETGIEGKFDVSASWRPESAVADPNDPRPSLFTAMEEQLGLKLTAQRRPVDVLVIDRVERPEPD
jgi:uncharacterized protein (TIGR03435 family)